jgi:hypothetical protein
VVHSKRVQVMKYEISALRAVVAHIQSQYPMKMRIYEFLLAVGFFSSAAYQNPKKNFDMDFHPNFKCKTLLIHKSIINKVYTQVNCTSNGVKIIPYLLEPMDFILVFFRFLNYHHNSCIFNGKT